MEPHEETALQMKGKGQGQCLRCGQYGHSAEHGADWRLPCTRGERSETRRWEGGEAEEEADIHLSAVARPALDAMEVQFESRIRDLELATYCALFLARTHVVAQKMSEAGGAYAQTVNVFTVMLEGIDVTGPPHGAGPPLAARFSAVEGLGESAQ